MQFSCTRPVFRYTDCVIFNHKFGIYSLIDLRHSCLFFIFYLIFNCAGLFLFGHTGLQLRQSGLKIEIQLAVGCAMGR